VLHAIIYVGCFLGLCPVSDFM
jgi:nucleolar complex protein 2